MPLTLTQILKPQTEAQAVAFLIDTLASLGLSTTSWQEGSIQRNVLQTVGRTYVKGTNTIQTIAQNVLVKPTGAWLDIVGHYRYGLDRAPPVAAERNVMFTSAASAPNHTILDGSYLSTPAGVRYRVVGDQALNTGQVLPFPVIAEFAGTAGNVPYTDAVSIQTPAYSGVTVAFINEDLTEVGVDEESDDRYWLRCQLRWTELTMSIGLLAYQFWALQADPSIRRAKAVNDYPTDGEVRIVLDPGTSAQIANVEAYVASRQHPKDDIDVSAASVVSQAIVYTPRIAPGASVTAMNAAIQAMLDKLPIGGTVIAGAVAGRLLRESITETLLCKGEFGVQSVGLITPATDIVLGATDVVTGAFTCTPETVF